MGRPKHIVRLTAEERKELEDLVKTGKANARKITHARILLKVDANGANWSDEQVQEALDVGKSTVERVRRAIVEEGLEASLNRKKLSRTTERKLDGDQEAHLIALTCSEAPEGRKRWTLRLLADKMVELEYVDTLSYETVRQVLKKNEIKPWLREEWCIPPKANGEFVARMEDILDLYKQPYDPKHPQVCMDETSKQLVKEIAEPIPVEPGHPKRIDYEYERNGVANLFILFEPLRGWRDVKVTEHRTRRDWAILMKELVDEHYPLAETIRLVMDNLNTHIAGALYETFEPAEAKRILDRLEFHHTPKHGSWLNMAEIEFSVLVLPRLVGKGKKKDYPWAKKGISNGYTFVSEWPDQSNPRCGPGSQTEGETDDRTSISEHIEHIVGTTGNERD